MADVTLNHQVVRSKGHDWTLCGVYVDSKFKQGETPCVTCEARYSALTKPLIIPKVTPEHIREWAAWAAVNGEVRMIALVRHVERLEAIIVAADDAAQVIFEAEIYGDSVG